MEWIETTGRTVDEAKDAALDRLGVDEADAEFEILAEAQSGLFGRLRSEARVRARVRPTAPRAKDDGRDRRRRVRDDRTGASEPAEAARPASPSTTGEAPSGEDPPRDGSRRRRKRRRRGGGQSTSPGAPPEKPDQDLSGRGPESTDQKGAGVEVDLERQAEIAADFVAGLAAEFGLSATVNVSRPDEETVEIQLSGRDLGLLIGPKGSTLLAIQNLARTVVFNRTGADNGHINVDVGGYRQKRTEALVRFATQVAEKVKTTGERVALEPMSAVDRKVVHDTIAAIDGVATVSEGEEPRRRVVVVPA